MALLQQRQPSLSPSLRDDIHRSSRAEQTTRLPSIDQDRVLPTHDRLPSMAATLSLEQHPQPYPRDVKRDTLKGTSPTTPQHISFPAVPTTEPAAAPVKRSASVVSSNAMSIDVERQDQSVSMDDPDDRMAAEVLAGLGKIDTARAIVPVQRPRTPSGYETPLKYYHLNIVEHTRSDASNAGQAEPLLSLLTSSHPWLGGTITGSMSAYSSTKNNSPRFIQQSADLIERHIGSTLTQTVGTVGRRTGVETSLRKYLGSKDKAGEQQDSANLIDPDLLTEDSPTSNKRRRISDDKDENAALGLGPIQRTVSIDTLPVYDPENRSPAYEATESPTSQNQLKPPSSRPPINPRSWSTQLMISTSGLGAALNEASLRSLKYVLGMLRSANAHVTSLMEALKGLLQEYQNSTSTTASSSGDASSREVQMEEGTVDAPASSSPQNQTLTQRIQNLNAEIWNTLKSVVQNVSRYTGGALPENASVVVRWQLMSVPGRWKRAQAGVSGSSSEEAQDSEGKKDGAVVASANKMLAFAVEGLDMMEQVGGVVDSTIESAERWLGSLGRKKSTSTNSVAIGEKRGREEDEKTGFERVVVPDTDALVDVKISGELEKEDNKQEEDVKMGEDVAQTVEAAP